MSRNLTISMGAVVAAFSLAQAAHAAPNLVVNGGFEDLTGLGAPNIPGGYNLPQFTSFAGWTVAGSSNGVSLHGPADPDSLFAAGGDWSMDLTGLSNQGYGIIQQTIATVVGHTYRLTFDIGNSPALNGDEPARIGAQVGSFLPAWNFGGGGRTGNAWETITYDFVADSQTSRLIFGGIANAAYVGFDNVSVVDLAVPEPGTWGLMLLGFGSLGLALRRKRVARA